MIIGIDLGTTNSLVAYYSDDKAKIIPNRLGANLTPSVVSIDEDGTIYVGETAKERRVKYTDSTVELFKRSMGTNKEYNIHGRKYRVEEIAALLLKALKEDAENYTGEKVDEAIISVPAYFNDAQRKATKRAGMLAGLKVERIISEPTAAAIAYGIDNKELNTKFLVFDLGGGTFDISILEKFENILEVRAVAGDNYIGGEDFTTVLMQMFLNEHSIDMEDLDRATIAHIRKQCERGKISFSDVKTSNNENKNNEIKISCNIDGEEYVSIITLEDYEQACQILLEKIRRPIERSLKDARLRLSDIDEIILVGGATKLPVLRKYVSKIFGRIPNTEINPDEVVALGVAIQSAMKKRNAAVKEIILTDVCPFTLGTEIVVERKDSSLENGHFLPIIERNTVIPVSRTETLYTANDNQERIRIRILQGESRYVKNNVYLGEICINVPPNRAGEESVDVTYTYDINSILEVEVKVNSTNDKKKIVLKRDNFDMTDEEIEERLQALSYLKISPRDEEENRQLLFKGESLYEESLGDTRSNIEKHLIRFEEALDSRNREWIEIEKEDFKEFLSMIEKKEEMVLN